jgi:ribosomal-protein-alanine N-acetyltransferase
MADLHIITTPRLEIVPFSEKYLTPRYVGWLNDPEVVRFSEQRHRKHTLESCRQYASSFIESPHYFWAITVIDQEFDHIGNINAYVDYNNLIADVGILIGEKRAWKQGYGLEAWSAVCDHLLNIIGMRKVHAGTMADNAQMLSLMHRAGMHEDGRRHKHYFFQGSEVDIIYAALFK